MILRSIYDFFLIFRDTVKHGYVWINIEDIIYWIFCSLVVFAMMYRENQGTPRGFAIIGTFLGMFIYHIGPSKLIVKSIVRVVKLFIKKVKKTYEKFVKLLQCLKKAFKIKKKK